jgi:acylphosphatase
MLHSLIISGNVQGVGFRAYIKNKAESLGLKGFVRNLPSGTVEIVANDPSFIEKLDDLPHFASIKKVVMTEYKERKDFEEFYIIRD